MSNFLSGLARTILPYEIGAILVLVFVFGAYYWLRFSSERRVALKAHKARVKLAIERARAFIAEATAARGGFIDNNQVESWRKAYEEDFAVVRNEGTKVSADVREIVEIYENLWKRVDEWNATFVREESARNDALFGRLDANQREACVADEVATLVVAGAGSGKTSTIEKKVEYLIKVRGVSPDDILLLSFTNKAADEMTERLAASLPDAHMIASTFHKFGLEVVKRHRVGSYDIADARLCKNTVLHAISADAMTDEECRGLLRFFAFYLNAEPSDPNGFKTFGDFINETRNMNLQTLRGFGGDNRADKTTFHGETVKSFEELEIANWLYLNGIAYEYERKYDKLSAHEEPVKHRHYKPDFYLPNYDIWIEHFGIDANGEPPRFFSAAERAAYKEGMTWKRNLHREMGTTLVESYSWWHFEGKLTEKLWEKLRAHGVKRRGIDPKPVWKRLLESPKANLVREFANLVSAFIALAKSNRISSKTLGKVLDRSGLEGNARRRVEGFLGQVHPLFAKYEEELAKENAIDFHDMINEATDYIAESPNDLHRFRYVIIDEFQDISYGRANLIKAVVAATGAKLFCVGDDWQSIYRFAGSDISIFTHFADHFGFARTIRLENTYRNSQELLAIAGTFVMKNRQQITKNLKSARHCERPVVCVPYGGETELADALHAALGEIAQEAKGEAASVLLLGRHNVESKWVLAAKDITADESYENFTWKPHKELKLRFMTVHKAKGLEADYVVLLNFYDDLMGFPNSIADDPILALLLSAKEDLAFAEERRLFYVALTRTKNRIYILTPAKVASVFLEDLPMSVQGAVRDETDTTAYCPKCKKGHLVVRRSNKDGKSFYGCSNYPRCDYTLPMQKVPITAETPRCTCGGFLVPCRDRAHGRNFIGCTSYYDLQPYKHVRYSLSATSNSRTRTKKAAPSVLPKDVK